MTTALVLGALVIYLVERLRPLAERWVVAREPKQAAKSEMPHTLQMLVMAETPGWAQEQVEERFRELKAELGSWEAVDNYVHAGANGSASRR